MTTTEQGTTHTNGAVTHTNGNGAVTQTDAGMTYPEAFRRIVERVNAGRSKTVDYRRLGVVSKWTMHKHDDIRVALEALTFTLRIGIAGKPQHVCDDGTSPQAEDVERVTRQILDYFAQPVPAH